MAGKSIQFSGINRAVSDYSQSGACEELISLRPTQTGLVPVKALSTMMQNITYQKVFEHNVGDATNYIAVYYDTDTGVLYIYRVRNSGIPYSTSLWYITVGSSFSVENVHVAIAGRIIVVSVNDDTADIHENRAFLWNGTEYVLQEADVPTITASFDFSTPELKEYQSTGLSPTDTIEEAVNVATTGIAAIQEENKQYLFGTAVVAIAFKTTDGNTFWTGNWYTINPEYYVDQEGLTGSGWGEDFVVASDSVFWDSGFEEFFAQYPDGGHCILSCSGVTTGVYTQIGGVKVTMNISQISGWNESTSTVKSIEIYASKPELYFSDSYSEGPMFLADNQNGGYLLYPRRPISDANLGGQLLYHQKTIDLKDLASAAQPVTLEFGGTSQVTNKTLEVDPGAVVRTGDILSYNSRFHYYNDNKRTYLSAPDFGKYVESADTLMVFVTYESENISKTGWVGNTGIPLYQDYSELVVVAPTQNIKEVVLYGYNNDTAEYITVKYAMTPSTAYNYSICSTGPYYNAASSDPDEYYEGFTTLTEYVDEKETNAINVSEQYNPFVFRVEHSYLAPSTILDVQPQMVAVSDVSFGDYPLNVFTAKGVYALLQGSGTVLYGAFRPVSNLVSTGNSAVTEAGTFFLASGSLWTVAGSRSVLVSDALSLGPHTFIRDCTGYQSIANGGTIYDISDYESQVSFEVFSDGAKISYNRYRDELIISNALYPYSYVLSLKYRQWFKIPYCLKQDSVGSDIVSEEPLEGTISAGTTGTISFDLTGATEDDTASVAIYTTEGDQYTMTYQLNEDTYASPSEFRSEFVSQWNSDSNLSEITAEAGQITGNIVDITLTFATRVLGEIDESVYTESWGSTHDISFTEYYSVLNFSDETDTGDILVHLQSRPFSFGYGYSHIHRLVSMVRTALTSEDENITAALYGSDNLQDWTLLTYSAKQGSTSGLKLSQLRTAPAARSWRYYTITIGGNIPVDTDFGPVLLDVESVIRRMG